jgi:hypothetical protein
MNLHLIAGQFLTVTLPDGQTVEIDSRSCFGDVAIFVNSPHGDCYESLNIDPWQDTDPDPSLSAAERNPSLCR